MKALYSTHFKNAPREDEKSFCIVVAGGLHSQDWIGVVSYWQQMHCY